MMHIDHTAKPNPDDPKRGDTYVSPTGRRLTVLCFDKPIVDYLCDGETGSQPLQMFELLLANLHMDPRGRYVSPHPTPDPTAPITTAPGVFRPGDRVVYKGNTATVREVDHEASAMLVTFESGETSAVPMTEAQLANENVAVSGARSGLAHLLTTELLKIPAHLSSVDPQEFQGAIEAVLATDGAQRLIRLHG